MFTLEEEDEEGKEKKLMLKTFEIILKRFENCQLNTEAEILLSLIRIATLNLQNMTELCIKFFL